MFLKQPSPNGYLIQWFNILSCGAYLVRRHGLWAGSINGPFFFEDEREGTISVNPEQYRGKLTEFLWSKLGEIQFSPLFFRLKVYNRWLRTTWVFNRIVKNTFFYLSFLIKFLTSVTHPFLSIKSNRNLSIPFLFWTKVQLKFLRKLITDFLYFFLDSKSSCTKA